MNQTSSKRWSLKFKDELFISTHHGLTSVSHGYYILQFDNATYGIFSKESFDVMKTEEILTLITNMLNDAYDLAFKDKQTDERLKIMEAMNYKPEY